jgi:hypothetical protein
LNEHNVVLAGLPRSGTTLTCHLLNKLPDTVALHEPISGVFKRLGDHDEIRREVERFFDATRESIGTRGVAISKHRAGRVPDNPVGDQHSESGLRQRAVVKGEIAVDKELGPSFLLAVKHPAAFTALLGTLVRHFPCYAVVRNPLSVLASWNSVEMSVQRGHAPIAEHLDGNLRQTLAGIDDRLGRQIALLSWFCEKYATALPEGSVVRYEDVVATGGQALRIVTPRAEALHEALESRNDNAAYDRRIMRRIGERLLRTDGAFWNFYTRDSVERLLEG